MSIPVAGRSGERPRPPVSRPGSGPAAPSGARCRPACLIRNAAAALRCRRGVPGRDRGAAVLVQLCGGRVPALAAVFAPEGGAVVQDRVDLPPLAVRCALDPELVLPGIAAGRAPLLDDGQA